MKREPAGSSNGGQFARDMRGKTPPTVGAPSLGGPATLEPEFPDYAALHGEVFPDADTSADQAHAVGTTGAAAGDTGPQIDLDLHRFNPSYPMPQADSLAKVALAVDAVAAGADTDDAIAHALRVTERQGAYYGNALGSLGLAGETVAEPRAWVLTSAGEQFLNADPATRAAILGHTVEQIPEVRRYLNDGADMDELLTDRYSDDTAGRRAKTLESWVNTVTDQEKAIRELTLENDEGRPLLSEAASIATQSREEARRRARTERPVEICDRCFIAKSATGVCSNCDD